MGKVFGANGIFGIANTDFTCETVFQVGRAVAMVLAGSTGHRARILIGKDTRRSSDMLENALAAGIASVGADVVLLGVVPTNAVSHMIVKTRADAGVMIAAHHPQVDYNGLRVFSDDGYPLTDALVEQVEAILFGSVEIPMKVGGDIGRIARWESAKSEYCTDLKRSAPNTLNGLKVLIDCANGAACETAKEIFPALYADCTIINTEPNGVNINRSCGSIYPRLLSGFMQAGEFDVGIAFDGAAERCIALDENGEVIDGDQILAICAADLKERGELEGDAFVASVMSNLGLRRYAEENGLSPVIAPVGDRSVLNLMLAEGHVLGGEPTGEIIFRNHAKLSDGQLTAIWFLSILKRRKIRASELRAEVPKFAHTVVNVTVANELKETVVEDRDVKGALREVGEQLGDAGRIFVRPSGTEPVIRVLVEAEEADTASAIAGHVGDIIESVARSLCESEPSEETV